MWGGRFASGPDDVFRLANDSIQIDWRLVEYDIVGSIAWANALKGVGVLTDKECDQITISLADVRVDTRMLASPPTESGAEDVHTWVEWKLIE